ncbi:GTPase-activating protein, partial [Proteus mirabilis]|uniref:GTPase-activating protein n=1 Tax=Proteus mirabilis TaxID=584 RepID=UPI002575E26B
MKKEQAQTNEQKDPRIGCKIPIPLIVDNQAPKVDTKKSAPAKMEPMRFSLEEEVALLETDTRLDELLSR